MIAQQIPTSAQRAASRLRAAAMRLFAAMDTYTPASVDLASLVNCVASEANALSCALDTGWGVSVHDVHVAQSNCGSEYLADVIGDLRLDHSPRRLLQALQTLDVQDAD